MASSLARHGRAAGLVPILLIAVCAVVDLQLAHFGASAAHRSHNALSATAGYHRPSSPSNAGGTGATTTTTTPPPPPTTTTSTTAPAQVPPPSPTAPIGTTTPPAPPPEPAAPASSPGLLPPRGQASVWGCAAALTYLSAYAYPGFTFECPGNALGHEGMTCLNEPGICPGVSVIAIADACPAVYMNEASNSWVLEGQSIAPIDPFGAC